MSSVICMCGHPRERHLELGLSTTCAAQVDRRHVTAGGDTLTPCACKSFEPMWPQPDARVG